MEQNIFLKRKRHFDFVFQEPLFLRLTLFINLYPTLILILSYIDELDM